MTRILHCLVAALVLISAPIETAPRTSPALPDRLERYLAEHVRLTPVDRQRLIDGAAVTKLLEVDASKEVAVFGAVWINASVHRYVELVNDIERFERRGASSITRRISAPPRIEDFAQLHLPAQDVADLRNCRVGDCEVKLSAAALERFRTEIDWRSPNVHAAADALMQRIALEYVTGYLEGGNDRLAVYRDNSRPAFVAREFREMIDQMPELTTFIPEVRRYLLGYPVVTLPRATSFLYWEASAFGLKSTIRIHELTIQEGPTDALVASKMLYASHYFWTGLELRALISDGSRGKGFWFVTVGRSRSDGLSGATGVFVRRRVRGEVINAATAALQSTKRKLEAGP